MRRYSSMKVRAIASIIVPSSASITRPTSSIGSSGSKSLLAMLVVSSISVDLEKRSPEVPTHGLALVARHEPALDRCPGALSTDAAILGLLDLDHRLLVWRV